MDVKSLLKKLRNEDIHISLNGENLQVSSDKPELPSDLLQEIRSGKAAIISYLKEQRSESVPSASIPRIPSSEDGYVLSSSQHRLWVLSRQGDANIAYNIPRVFEFEGNLDTAAFSAAFNAIVERHEIMRTVFGADDEGKARQYVKKTEELGPGIRFHDLRHEAAREDLIKEFVQEAMETSMEPTTGPLFSATLYRTGHDKWVLVCVMHHIITDGWSMGIMFTELMWLYKAHVRKERSPLQPLRIQYKDYAAWQQEQLGSGAMQVHRDYWLKQFEGELPLLELPCDKPRPTVKTHNGGDHRTLIDAQIGKELKEICQQQGGTLFMGLLAAVNVLFYRYTAQEDIIIGSPIAGRQHTDLEDQIGFYVNTLALRSRFRGDKSFRELLQEVKQVTLGAYEHEVFPFDELVDALDLRHDLGRSPLFDVMVVLQNNTIGDMTPSIEGLEVNPYEEHATTVSKLDLLFTFVEIPGSIYMAIEFNSDIWSHSSIERMAAHLKQLLPLLIAQPDRALCALDYLSEAEKKELVVKFNDTSVDYPRNRTIVELFAEQAQKTPDRTAWVFEDTEMSYRELHEKSNQLANYLKETSNIQPDDMIGIMLDRSDKTIIAILGVLKSGAAYVPIEPDYPDARKEFIMKDTGIKALVTRREFTFDLGYFNGDVFLMDSKLDTLETSKEMPELFITPESLAYVMYTSGSTGNPKGVLVEHGSVVRLVKSANFVTLTGDEVLLSTGAVSFDATTFEYWSMLLNGGKLVMCSSGTLLDSSLLAQEIRNRKVDMMWFTAGWLSQLVDENIELFDGLKTLLAGGDKLSAAHIQKLRDRYPQMQIVNGYGPTENTTFSLTHNIETVWENIPIGKPISNSTAYILDAQHQLVAVGVAGEICVGGDGLARGYQNNSELTAEKFIMVDLPLIGRTRIYKTGDLGRWLEDGSMEFLGRKDEQVKVRGYRIELGEIKSALQNHERIGSCAVVAKTNRQDEKELVAYVTAEEELNASELRSWLGRSLPNYMIPAHYVQLNALPLTPNGKVDYKALPDPAGLEKKTSAEYVAPRDETEEKLVVMWQEVLGRERIGVKDNFFELGGHSLKATRLANSIRKELGLTLDMRALFSNPTIEAIAGEIKRINWANNELTEAEDTERFTI